MNGQGQLDEEPLPREPQGLIKKWAPASERALLA